MRIGALVDRIRIEFGRVERINVLVIGTEGAVVHIKECATSLVIVDSDLDDLRSGWLRRRRHLERRLCFCQGFLY